MFDVILFQPKIPPNTGNAIRLCANSGARLHLVRPLGFSLDDAQLRRAGLDYHEYASVQRSEEHTSELQSLMRISYAVFCLKKKQTSKQTKYYILVSHDHTYTVN